MIESKSELTDHELIKQLQKEIIVNTSFEKEKLKTSFEWPAEVIIEHIVEVTAGDAVEIIINDYSEDEDKNANT